MSPKLGRVRADVGQGCAEFGGIQARFDQFLGANPPSSAKCRLGLANFAPMSTTVGQDSANFAHLHGCVPIGQTCEVFSRETEEVNILEIHELLEVWEIVILFVFRLSGGIGGILEMLKVRGDTCLRTCIFRLGTSQLCSVGKHIYVDVCFRLTLHSFDWC